MVMVYQDIASGIGEIIADGEKKRLDRFATQWKAYYGQLPEPLKVRFGEINDNVLLNFMRPLVDKGVSFLFGREVRFNLDTEDEQRNAQEQYLDEVWDANHKQTTLMKFAIAGGICGHAFIKIQPTQTLPRLLVQDPATVSVRYDPNDIERVTRYKVQYTSMNPDTGRVQANKQVIEQGGTGRWTIADYVSTENDARWQQVGPTVMWPYAWAPMHHCQNLPAPNEFWGISDIEADIVAVNKAINFNMSNTNRILRYHAHPKTIVTGISGIELPTEPGGVLQFDAADAKMYNLEMQSDLGSSLAYYARLKEALHEVSRVPEVAMGKLENVGPVSGIALQILYSPLLEKTETKRCLYGDMLADVNKHLLEMGGHGPDNVVLNQWPQLLPTNSKEEAETLLLHQQIGASEQTLLEKLGYDPALEAEHRQVTTQDAGEKMLGAMEKGIGPNGQTLE